jgi:hypothetical protein
MDKMTTKKPATKKSTTKKSDKNPTVFIHLDRPREVRFGHKALKRLSKLTGKKLTESINQNDFDLEELESILYCGLLSDAKEHNETLELADMEDLLDLAPSMTSLLEAMNQALDNAFMETEQQKN